MNAIISLFENRMDDIFLQDDDLMMSYREFLQKSVYIKQIYFSDKKIEKICIISSSVVFCFCCYIAALLAGKQIVPIDPEKGTGGIQEILDIVQPECIVSDIQLDQYQVIVISLNDISIISYNECLDMLREINMKKPYLVTFTSGTTAVPKGVVHSFGNLVESARAFGKEFDFNDKHIFYHHFPISYMAGILNQFIMPMIFGCRIAIGKRFSANQALNFWEKPIQYGANVFWMAPTMLQLLMRLDRGTKGSRYCAENNVVVLVGTAPLTLSLRKRFESRYHRPIYESYGLTETLFVATNSANQVIQDGCVGKMLDGIEAQINLDGELTIRASWMFLYYFEDAWKLTHDNMFLTGDIADIVGKRLYIIGRKKDLIIRGGMNISPGKIEKELGQNDSVPECTIIALPDEILGEKIVMVYCAKERLSLDMCKQINVTLKNQLGQEHCIDQFCRVNELIKNVNGKIDKHAIKMQLLNN